MIPDHARTCIHDPEGIATLRRRLKTDPSNLRRVWNRLFKQGRTWSEAAERMPEGCARAWQEHLRLHSLKLTDRQDSVMTGASKLRFVTEDGLGLETVILRSRFGRGSLCLSSQVGCGVGCRFCATGLLGARRNLNRAEILDQVLQGRQVLAAEGRPLRNLVFMGMGEPLHNEAEVYAALESLADPRRFDLSLQRCTLSTVGIAAAMRRCAAAFPRLRLALSLHAADQQLRTSLIPLARHEPLDELRTTCLELGQRQPILIEYVMIAGRNDRSVDLQNLSSWTEGMACQINLIPLNPVPGIEDLEPSSTARIRAFADALRQVGRQVTLRHSLGKDIAAACGQLVRPENQRAGICRT